MATGRQISAALIFLSVGGFVLAATAKPLTPTRFVFAAERRPPDDKSAFFAWLGPMARHVMIRTGIPASVTLSQAWRESRGGDGRLSFLAAYPHHNLYGMKAGTCGSELATGTVRAGTWEDTNGNGRRDPDEGTGATFAAFPNYYVATLAHARLFYCAGAYSGALPYRSNARVFLDMMATAYATDAGYSAAVWADVEHYGLTSYDVPAAQWALDPGIVPPVWYAAWRNAVGGVPA